MSTSHSEGMGLSDRLFRASLRALPREFRSRYGREIYEYHRTRLEEVPGAGLRRFHYWALAMMDVLLGGIGERFKTFGRALRPGAGSPPGRDGRETGGLGLGLDLLFQDIRYSFRSLLRQKAFTAVSVLSLAVGIGLFAGFFAFVQETWLRPIPGVTQAESVVELTTLGRDSEFESWAYPDFRDLRSAQTPFLDLAGWKERDGTLSTEAGGEPVRMMYVSASYFQVLGVTPNPGRGFMVSEDTGPGQHPVVVVSHRMWQDRLGGDPEIIGSSLLLNRTPFTVIGVTPEAFTGHRALVPETEVWLPLMQDPWIAGPDSWMEDREALWLRVLGRLKEGATLEEANAAMATIFSRLEEEHPEANEGRRARGHAFGPVPALGRSGSFAATALLAGLLGLVLVIICGNVAGMVLARSVTREQELAVRLAMGSGRGRLARLLGLEALLLALAGGAGGIFLGVWGTAALYSMIPDFPAMEFRLGLPLLIPMGTVVVGTALLVGLLPALRFSRPELVSSLKEGSGGSGRRAGRVHRVAASAQAGLALTLLVMSLLFVRAMGVLQERDLGFEPRGLLMTHMDLSNEGFESPDLALAFLDRAQEAVAAVPGVTEVALADGIPIDLVGNFTGVARLDLPDDPAGRVMVEFTKVGEGFFETIGTPVLQGRGIEATDDLNSELVMVITESLADRLWPGEDVVGRRVRSGMSREGPREFTIVGVVPNVASSRATEDWPNIFVPLRQNYSPRVMLVFRGPGDPSGIMRPVQDAILGVDANLPFPIIVGSETLVRRAAGSQRMSAGVAGGLGILALLLAAIGVYGVVAFSVSRRTREIGLRMAMGATRPEILWGVLKDAVRLSVPGMALGALAAGGTAAGLGSQLFGLSPADPVSFLGAGSVLFLVVLVASLYPARRASGIDPMQALRDE